MFKDRKTLTEENASLKARVSELETDAESIDAERQALSTRLSEAQSELATAREDLQAATETNNTLTGKLEASAENLKTATAKLSTFDDEVAKAAKAQTAANLDKLGHPQALDLAPDPNDPADPAPSSDPVADFAKIEDSAEAYTFATENREAILAGIFTK